MMTTKQVDEAIRVVFDRVSGGAPGQYSWTISEALMEVYRAGYAAGQAAAVPRDHPSDAELALWKALGRWSAEICRLDAELAPPQYLLDAVAALGAGAEGAK